MSWSPTLFRKVVALVAAFGVIAVPRQTQRSYSCRRLSGTRRQDPCRSPWSRSTECGSQPTSWSSCCRSPVAQAPKNQPRCQSLAASKGCYWPGCRTHRRIAAVERSPPPRGPEVLVGCVEAPRRRQVDAGGVLQGPASTVKVGTAVDAVSDDAVGSIKATLYPPVVVRRVLHDVARRTFGVDALHCGSSRLPPSQTN